MGLLSKQWRLNVSLSEALYHSNEDEARALLQKGAQVNRADGHFADSPYSKTRGSHYGSPLYSAVSRGLSATVDLLIERGADPNLAVYGSDTALMRAARDGKAAIVERLLKAGADPEMKDGSSWTALQMAAAHGAGTSVEALVRAGAGVNATATSDGATALHLAAAKGYANIVRFLVENGADALAKNANLNTPADVAEKDFPRIADYIRTAAAQRPAPAPAPAAAASGPELRDWTLTAPDEVAHVAERPGIGYRLTEIFNFTAGTYTRLAQNLKTGAESQVLRFFDEFPDAAALDRAHGELMRLGGNAPRTPAAQALDKPAPGALNSGAPGPGGR
jgi:hypothetical protein